MRQRLFSSRDALVVVLAVVLGAVALSSRGDFPRPGTQRTIEFLFVPKDRQGHRCASDQNFDGFRCSFSAQQVRIKGIKSEQELYPAVSVHEELVLMDNPFLSTTIAEEAQRRKRRPRKKRKFRVKCRVEHIAQVDRVLISFNGRNFSPSGKVWVVKTLSCTVPPPKAPPSVSTKGRRH